MVLEGRFFGLGNCVELEMKVGMYNSLAVGNNILQAVCNGDWCLVYIKSNTGNSSDDPGIVIDFYGAMLS